MSARLPAYPLACERKGYAWGSRDAIPRLLGIAGDGGPWAELWMGAHPDGPSRVEGGAALGDLIAADAAYNLGGAGDSLPFLLKLLSAAEPLSLQAHPSREEALRGFRAEDEAGVPRGSEARLYKDGNHKPEILAALGPFEAMCGFRPYAETARLAAALASAAEGRGAGELRALAAMAGRAASEGRGAFERFYRALAGLELPGEAGRRPPAESAALADAAALAARKLAGGDRAFSLAAELAGKHPGDPGIVAPLYLNVLRLDRLQALFIPHGTLHTYIVGTGVELMASSDNVLRGGLTPKVVDAAALASILDYEPFDATPLSPGAAGAAGWERYPDRCGDFSLALARGGAARCGALPEILFCAEGSFELSFPGSAAVPLPAGRAAFVPAGSGTYAAAGKGLLFRAATGASANPS